MNATILNGALAGDGYVDAIAAALQDGLRAQSWTVRPWQLADEKLAFCLGCFECWTKTPGLCRIDDAGRDVAESLIQSDLAIFVTPITFGGYSSALKKAVDRVIPLISPFFERIDGEVHHHARYASYPALFGVGVLSRPNPIQAEIFDTLISRNAINLHAPAHGSRVILRGQDPIGVAAELTQILSKEALA
jgi:multimeric flavodoxin WrbA